MNKDLTKTILFLSIAVISIAVASCFNIYSNHIQDKKIKCLEKNLVYFGEHFCVMQGKELKCIKNSPVSVGDDYYCVKK